MKILTDREYRKKIDDAKYQALQEQRTNNRLIEIEGAIYRLEAQLRKLEDKINSLEMFGDEEE